MTLWQWVGLGAFAVFVVWYTRRTIREWNHDAVMGVSLSWPPTLAQIRDVAAAIAIGAGYILAITSAGTGPRGLAGGIALVVLGIVILGVWGRRQVTPSNKRQELTRR